MGGFELMDFLFELLDSVTHQIDPGMDFEDWAQKDRDGPQTTKERA